MSIYLNFTKMYRADSDYPLVAALAACALCSERRNSRKGLRIARYITTALNTRVVVSCNEWVPDTTPAEERVLEGLLNHLLFGEGTMVLGNTNSGVAVLAVGGCDGEL